VDLGIGALEQQVGQDGRAAVARARDEHHIEIVPTDRAVQMKVDEVEAWGGAPMAEQSRLDMLSSQRLRQEGDFGEISVSDGKIVDRSKVRVHLVDQLRG